MRTITTDTIIDAKELQQYLIQCDMDRLTYQEGVSMSITATRYSTGKPNQWATGSNAWDGHLRTVLFNYIHTLEGGHTIPDYSTTITTWDYCHECETIMCNCMGYGPF